MNKYLNYWGLIFFIVILIPNIVFTITCKTAFKPYSGRKYWKNNRRNMQGYGKR